MLSNSIAPQPNPNLLPPLTLIKPTHPRAHTPLNQPADRIQFGAAKQSQDALIQKEVKRLIRELPNGWLAPLLPMRMNTMEQRARYNLTGDPVALHAFLPYRKQLAETNAPALQQYDQLVGKIMDTAEFYQVPTYKEFRKKLRPLYHNQTQRSVFYPVYAFFKKLALVIRRLFSSKEGWRNYRLHYAQAALKNANKIDNQALKNLAKNTTPLQDKSTRYLIAAGMAELLHQHPEYADRVLNPEHQRPLRFVVSNEKSGSILGGQDNVGSNVIWLYQTALWSLAQQKFVKNPHNIAQHEFIHALSESNGLETLPMMNKLQVQRFKAARTKLFQQFDKNDNTWTAWYNAIVTGKAPSVGIHRYGFTDNAEFLAVSLDTFKYNPLALCKTEAGKDLYDLYKELFGIDPLSDIKNNETGLNLSALYNLLRENESKSNSPA